MIPPGLAFVSVSAKAWKAYETATLPKFYLDLGPYRKTAAKDSTPFTPPVNLFFALQAALNMMKKRGVRGHLCSPRSPSTGNPGGHEGSEFAAVWG